MRYDVLVFLGCYDQTCYKKIASIGPTHHMANHRAIILQTYKKIIASTKIQSETQDRMEAIHDEHQI